MEQLQAQLAAMQADLLSQRATSAEMTTEIQRMRTAEAAQIQTAQAMQAALMQTNAQLAQGQQELMTALTAAQRPRAERDQISLIDNKGIGKPTLFKGSEEKFLPWKIRFENFLTNTFPDIAEVLEWAEERDTTITPTEVHNAYCIEGAVDFVPRLMEKQQQLFTVLQQLCEEEPFDIVTNCGKGNGLEAWRRINRRYDPATAGRKRALLKHIITP